MSLCLCVFFQAEDGIRDLVRSRGLGDVYKRQVIDLEQIEVLHLAGQHGAKSLTNLVRQQLAVGKGEIGRAAHGRVIGLPLWRLQRRADQLAVRQMDAVLVLSLIHI